MDYKRRYFIISRGCVDWTLVVPFPSSRLSVISYFVGGCVAVVATTLYVGGYYSAGGGDSGGAGDDLCVCGGRGYKGCDKM